MATLVSISGEEMEIRVAKGWQEIHLPKTNVPPRFYTRATDFRSDHEYTVYSLDHNAEGERFREVPAIPSVQIKEDEVAVLPTTYIGVDYGSEDPSTLHVWKNTEAGLDLVEEESPAPSEMVSIQSVVSVSVSHDGSSQPIETPKPIISKPQQLSLF